MGLLTKQQTKAIQMKDEQRIFLTLPRPPARLTVDQVAWMLNCQAHDIPVLVAARLLKPLGNPPVSSAKHYSSKLVVELAQDPTWLAKMTNAIHDYWHNKNQRRRPRQQDGGD